MNSFLLFSSTQHVDEDVEFIFFQEGQAVMHKWTWAHWIMGRQVGGILVRLPPGAPTRSIWMRLPTFAISRDST